jgi:two-component system, NarL family, response regulator DevR
MDTMTIREKSDISTKPSRLAERRSKTVPREHLIRLLLVDDHEVVRLGLRALFNRTGTIHVVGEAGTMESAVSEAVRLKPDVILMDVRLPDGDGIEACRDIRSECPDTHVLFLTSYPDEAAVRSTVYAGASGFLLKEIGSDALVQAVETVAKGQSIFDTAAVQRMLAQIQSRSEDDQPSLDDALSPRDERILALVAEGKTNKEIAVELGLSDKTIKNLLSVIFQKLQISRRSQAAALFVKRAKNHGYPAIPEKDK